MSTLRQMNWLSQQRVDISDLRMLESSIAADFDALAGEIFAGGDSYVVRGFSIGVVGIGNSADSLVLNVADGKILHRNGSESGTMFTVPVGRTSETLSPTNARITGSFTANSFNYVSLDLTRTADASTSDLTRFLDANTLLEISRVVPKARTLDYKIVISTEGFSVASNLLPIAIVQTDSGNLVLNIEDARPMLFGLGSGGDNPNPDASYAWGDRSNQLSLTSSPGTDPFSVGDKNIVSLKEWMDSIATRVWELGGGEAWYSATSDRDVKVAYGSPTLPKAYLGYTAQTVNFTVGQTVTGGTSGATGVIQADDDNPTFGTLWLSSVVGTFQAGETITDGLGGSATADGAQITTNGQNFYFYLSSGKYYLQWSGLKAIFANSTAVTNTIKSSSSAYGAAGVQLPDGYGLYVDFDRETDGATVTPQVEQLESIGSPVRPGSRFLLAWRSGTECYTRDQAFEVGRTFPYATNVSFGVVRLYDNDNEAFAAGTPEVVSTNSFDAAHGVPKLNSGGTKLQNASGTLATWSIAGAAGNSAATASLYVVDSTAINGDYFIAVRDSLVATPILALTRLSSARGTLSLDGELEIAGRSVIADPDTATTGVPDASLYVSRAPPSQGFIFAASDTGADGGYVGVKRQTGKTQLLVNVPASDTDDNTSDAPFTINNSGDIVDQKFMAFAHDGNPVGSLSSLANGNGLLFRLGKDGVNAKGRLYVTGGLTSPDIAVSGNALVKLTLADAVVNTRFLSCIRDDGTAAEVFSIRGGTGDTADLVLEDGSISWTTPRTKTVFQAPVLLDGTNTSFSLVTGATRLQLDQTTSKAFFAIPSVPFGASITKVIVHGRFVAVEGTSGLANLEVTMTAWQKPQQGTLSSFSTIQWTKSGTFGPTTEEIDEAGAVITRTDGANAGDYDVSGNGGVYFDTSGEAALDKPHLGGGTNPVTYIVGIEVTAENAIAATSYMDIHFIGVEYTYDDVDNC